MVGNLHSSGSRWCHVSAIAADLARVNVRRDPRLSERARLGSNRVAKFTDPDRNRKERKRGRRDLNSLAGMPKCAAGAPHLDSRKGRGAGEGFEQISDLTPV